MQKTPLLSVVIQTLSRSQKPLSIPELQQILACDDLHPNKTTLYRMMEKLTRSGKVESLLLDSKVQHYEIKSHHHHHFQCGRCREVRCVSDPALESQIKNLVEKLSREGLKVQGHSISLTGLCSICT